MSATSAAQVCGFIATIRSTPQRRPSQPRSDTRTSYQVGRPWMLDGKMLRGLHGTPMRRMALANSAWGEAERTRGVKGKKVAGRVELECRRIMKKTTNKHYNKDVK